MSLILITDSAGTPKNWVATETGACYYARQKVLWETGPTVKTFLGGISAINGSQSKIQVSSIIGVSGPILGHEFYFRDSVYAERMMLYARDKHICAYCGNRFEDRNLTIDHVLPKSKGGKNTWVNCVTACRTCNHKKADRTPEQARMHLLYVPYSPNLFEKMILKNRKILQDQMQFLIIRVAKHSRLLS